MHTWKGPVTDSMTYGDHSFAIHTADSAYLYGYNIIFSLHLRIWRIQVYDT